MRASFAVHSTGLKFFPGFYPCPKIEQSRDPIFLIELDQIRNPHIQQRHRYPRPSHSVSNCFNSFASAINYALRGPIRVRMLTPIIYNLTILYRRSSRHVLVALSAFASHLSINNPPPHSIPATASLCQRLESLLVSVTLKSMMTTKFCHLQSYSDQCQL